MYYRSIRVRAEQRLKEKRAKAIDHVAKLLHLADKYPVSDEPAYHILKVAYAEYTFLCWVVQVLC